jgi:hypothetical protein
VTVVFDPATSGTAVVVTAAIAGVAVIVVIPTELSATARMATRLQVFLALIPRAVPGWVERPDTFQPCRLLRIFRLIVLTIIGGNP